MAALRVFISHASVDNAFAERLADDLRRAGADVALDGAHLSESGDFGTHISQTLSAYDVLLLVLSPAAITSQWAPAEMNAAIVRANQGLMRQPLLVQCAPVPSNAVAGLWTMYPRLDMASDYYAAMSRLLMTLGLAPRTATPVQQPLAASPQAMYGVAFAPAPSGYQPVPVVRMANRRRSGGSPTTKAILIAAGLAVALAIVMIVYGLVGEYIPIRFLDMSLGVVAVYGLFLAIPFAFLGGISTYTQTHKLPYSLATGAGIAAAGIVLGAVGDFARPWISDYSFRHFFTLGYILRLVLVNAIAGGVIGVGAGALGGLLGRGITKPAGQPGQPATGQPLRSGNPYSPQQPRSTGYPGYSQPQPQQSSQGGYHLQPGNYPPESGGFPNSW